jgi:hypothetical protein
MSVVGSSLISPSAGRHLEHTVITLTAHTRPTTIAAVAGSRRAGPELVAVRDGLWRVLDRTGAVIGHIERQAHADGEKYLARRIVMSSRRIELGAFWRMADAADCFR